MRILIITIVCCLLCAGAAATDNQWQKNYSVSGKPQVNVRTNDGLLQVSSWPRSEVAFVVSQKGRKLEKNVQIEQHAEGNQISLTIRVAHFPVSINLAKSLSVQVMVPIEADLDLGAGDGQININNVAGNLRLQTSDGSIEASGLDGTLHASTSNGNIQARGRFDELALSTKDGHVDADVNAGSKLVSHWSVHTGDGKVRLRLPNDLKAEIDARTGDGHISVDLPVAVSGTVSEHHLHGTINSGGPLFEIQTGNGSIQISKLEATAANNGALSPR